MRRSNYVNTATSMNNMIRDEEILNDAIDNLERLAGLQDSSFQMAERRGYDYDVIINGITFACVVKHLVNKANYNLIVKQMHDVKRQNEMPLLVVAQHVVPSLLDNFTNDGICVMESNGNCNIHKAPLFVHISGQKNKLPKAHKGKAFNEVGLKLVFYLLLDNCNINKPYRKISEDTGLSLGAIKNVIEELVNSLFVIKTNKGRILNNKMELLNQWQIHYNQTLKPKLLMKELEFASSDSQKDWAHINLPEGMCWGGEGGAHLLDGYLIPEKFDIYTEVPSIKLVMGKRVKYKDNGHIRMYQKFWKGSIEGNVAPRILVYADLMGSSNSRCIEAAQKLIENGI